MCRILHLDIFHYYIYIYIYIYRARLFSSSVNPQKILSCFSRLSVKLLLPVLLIYLYSVPCGTIEINMSSAELFSQNEFSRCSLNQSRVAYCELRTLHINISWHS